MMPVSIPLYGPLTIHSYGLMIFIGLIIFSYLTLNHPRRHLLLTSDHLINLIALNVVTGIMGGRLLYCFEHWHSIESWYALLTPWEGGLSSMGALIALFLTTAFYLRYYQLPLVPVLDLAAINGPLLWAIARFGCFFAGCCYGIPTLCPWAPMYTNPLCLAPLNIRLHPTQLYSAGILFGIWLFMRLVATRRFLKTGQLSCLFLLLTSIERFSVDFLRSDRTIVTFGNLLPDSLLSVTQCITLVFIVIASFGLYMVSKRRIS